MACAACGKEIAGGDHTVEVGASVDGGSAYHFLCWLFESKRTGAGGGAGAGAAD